ncbi:homoserine dehydrogenase [Aminipila butyrica]|uniref:Homoserine dehydrogenase n=1 Tax=Aminipila butyrica TaxID=433296 RepID=A0A858BUH9_9FIRM|nr:homoserine dehydrogenase [Aminipila butyrica]QIB69593.1 homoserine dehydrogenase [Aminipila butyrica]
MRTLKLALLGFGNAGRAFAKILEDKRPAIRETMGWDILVTGITTGSRGSLYAAEGLDLQKAWSELEEKGHFEQSNRAYSTMTSLELVETGEYDVIVEMTPLNIFTGEPASEHLRKAMERKKHAVTANKGPIAWHYKELKALAEKQGVQFYYETTVMDGTPIFNLKDETLRFCQVTEVSGILNTTTNFVLEELAKGKAYEDVLQEGKKLGFVEADPSMDIEGWDAAAKVTALLNVLMEADITPDQVERTGIEHITIEDIKAAEENGKVIKLLCQGTLEAGQVKASVQPTLVEKGSLLAAVEGTSSVVQITTDLMGKLTIIEHDPDLVQTGYGVFSDVLRVVKNFV